MSKRSGSKSSRSERRAGRRRAERAREHGLPEPRPAPLRVRAATPEPLSRDADQERWSDAPVVPLRKFRIPTLVKVIGAAFVILLGVYLLSLQRDKALTEPSASPEPAVSSAVSVPPEPSAIEAVEAPPAEAPSLAPARLVPGEPPTPPVAPSVSVPAAKPPSRPSVPRAAPPSAKTVAPVPTPAPPAPPAPPITPAE